MSPPDQATILEFCGASLARPGSPPVIVNLNWTIRTGESWALVGPSGSGKTTVLEAMAGHVRVSAGKLERPLIDRMRRSGRPIGVASEVIKLITFRDGTNRFHYDRHYYQQRFNFIEPEDELTVDEFLTADLAVDAAVIDRTAERLGIQSLRGLSFLKLSNGQSRRVRIARCLLLTPAMLLLDDPFVGLDTQGRSEFAELLRGLVDDGIPIVISASTGDIPSWVTHVKQLDATNSAAVPFTMVAGPKEPSTAEQPPVVELRHASVSHGGSVLLDCVDWTIRQGERWALTGPNGSGKSTLLSLIAGDHPQVYANDVRLFGSPRGAGETIWDIKKRIGFLSPEFHLYFTARLSVTRLIAGGFADRIIPEEVTADQIERIREHLTYFGLGEIGDAPFQQLPTGRQRTILLIRALIKSPALLLLDEPFQGMDAAAVAAGRRYLDQRLTPTQTLIFVTHVEAEIPTTVGRRAAMNRGRLTIDTPTAPQRLTEPGETER